MRLKCYEDAIRANPQQKNKGRKDSVQSLASQEEATDADVEAPNLMNPAG